MKKDIVISGDKKSNVNFDNKINCLGFKLSIKLCFTNMSQK